MLGGLRTAMLLVREPGEFDVHFGMCASLCVRLVCVCA
jgi:hypothetical protein